MSGTARRPDVRPTAGPAWRVVAVEGAEIAVRAAHTAVMPAGQTGEITRLKGREERDAATIVAQDKENAWLKEAKAGLNQGQRYPHRHRKRQAQGEARAREAEGEARQQDLLAKDIDYEEFVDCVECPECCKSDMLSGRTDSYDRVVTSTIIKKVNGLYVIPHRYCHRYDKQVSSKPVGILSHARNNVTHDRIMTRLNLHGLSHGKCIKLARWYSGRALRSPPRVRTRCG